MTPLTAPSPPVHDPVPGLTPFEHWLGPMPQFSFEERMFHAMTSIIGVLSWVYLILQYV